MAREIKFRAWDTQEKEMREVAMLRWEDGRMSRIAGYWPGTRNNGWTDYDPDEGRYVLMQFTGLHDKNGKEIYEGDVIERGTEQKVRKIVEWNTAPNKPVGFNIGDKKKGIAWKVIGNIYENPELLA